MKPLQIFCDDKLRTWSLALDMTGAVARALRLSVAPQAHTGARSGKVVAEIREPRQIDAVMVRVIDTSVEPHDLSEELTDLLLTLATEKPSAESIAYLKWRLCEWIADSRRSRFSGENVA